MKVDFLRNIIVSIFIMSSSLGAIKVGADILKLPTNSVKVTYIANAGYLIESSDNKILIDALFTKGLRLYNTPSAETYNKIINGNAPFDNIKTLFITHGHEDHFSSFLVTRFLEMDENRYVICSDITRRILEAKIGTDKYNLYKDRVRDITPEIYSSIDSNVDDMNFKIIRLRHSGANESDKNLGYLISMNGINILHTGDNDGYIADSESISGIEEYLKLNIEKKVIDIAIVNRGMFWEKNSPGIEIIKKYIKPKVVILAHLSKNDAQGELSSVMDVVNYNKNVICNVIIFENSLDSKYFEF